MALPSAKASRSLLLICNVRYIDTKRTSEYTNITVRFGVKKQFCATALILNINKIVPNRFFVSHSIAWCMSEWGDRSTISICMTIALLNALLNNSIQFGKFSLVDYILEQNRSIPSRCCTSTCFDLTLP